MHGANSFADPIEAVAARMRALAESTATTCSSPRSWRRRLRPRALLVPLG